MRGALRVGTRASRLALRQTELVVAALRSRAPDLEFEVVPLSTQGDRTPRRPVGLDFTDAIDRALEEGRLDLAVHSTKDLPIRAVRAVRVAAFPPRADPRDGLVSRGDASLADLPSGARIGSSSPRRRAQLLRARPDLRLVEVRGNVDTRLGLVEAGRVDGVVLAVAGLTRIGRAAELTQILPRARFPPAPGQGALAVATRISDRAVERLVRTIDHRRTRATVTAERSFVDRLGGDCDTPLGASAAVSGGRLTLRGEVLSPDGARSVGGTLSGALEDAGAIGRRLGGRLLQAGAEELLALSRRPGRGIG